MLKKLYVTLFIVSLLGGMTYFISLALKGKSIPKIKLSYFQSPQEIAGAVHQIIQQHLANEPILLFGVMPDNELQMQVARAFAQIQDPKTTYNQVVFDTSLGVPDMQTIDTVNNLSIFAQGLQTALTQKQRVIVIVPSYQSTHSLKENVVDQLKTQYRISPLSISLVSFPDHREDEKNLAIPCNTNPDRDTGGVGDFGCLILNKARSLYYKKIDKTRVRGFMDQFGEKDYLLFLNGI